MITELLYRFNKNWILSVTYLTANYFLISHVSHGTKKLSYVLWYVWYLFFCTYLDQFQQHILPGASMASSYLILGLFRATSYFVPNVFLKYILLIHLIMYSNYRSCNIKNIFPNIWCCFIIDCIDCKYFCLCLTTFMIL